MQATKSRLDVAGDSDEQETGSEISTNDPPEVIIDQLKIQNLPKGVTHRDDCQLPVDILLVTVKDYEFLSCLSYLNPGFCKTFYQHFGLVYLGDMGEDERKLNIAVLKCFGGSASPGGSMIVVSNAVNILRPKAVFCVGSCRSLDYDKVKLGDIIMSEKFGEFGIAEGGIEKRFVEVPINSLLLRVILNAGDSWNPPLKDPKALEVKIHRGTILSGPLEVIDSPKNFKALIDRFPESVAMEEEGQGLFAAAHDLDIPCIFIKGISGYAGGRKSKETSWRPFASVLAASLTAHILSDAIIFQNWPHFPGTIPFNILARGPLAKEVYNRELKEGHGYARRVPIMIIGQARSGKTSLKKSLKGESFNPNEGCTEGIETDPSYFKVTTDVWRTGQKRTGSNSEDTETEPEFLLDRQLAQNIFKGLKEKERLEDPSTSGTKPTEANSPPTEHSEESSSNSFEPSPQDSKVVDNANAPSLRTEVAVEPEELKTSSLVIEQIESDPSTQDSKDQQKVPENVAALVQELLKDNKKFMEGDDMYSVIWDFGGRSVFYDTHPIFLTEKAIYILAYDLSRDPYQKADAPVKQGMYKDIEDTDCQKTNFDYLDFWMSSIYSLGSKNTNRQKTSSLETLPPVFLACTHADEPYTKKGNPSKEIYGALKDKIYRDLLKGFFVVDNTKSGSNDECQGVKKLRESVLSVAKELPQMKEKIPLKWLKYEKVLYLLMSKGRERIFIEEARQVAVDECGIDDDVTFRTVLNFLHDQKVLINFNELPELESMVILNPQWLVDVFKEVITFKSFNPPENSVESSNTTENSVEILWKDFETTGILDTKVLDHIWQRFIDPQETCKSLIAIMERFSLLCSWPSQGTTELYLVPSMLRSPPTGDVLEVLASAQIPSLFVRFDSRRVPPGLFSRLILLFHKWTQERWMSPIEPLLFNNFALFYICPHNATSVVLLCHSSSIEIVFCVGDGVGLADETSFSGGVDLNVSRDIHRQMRVFLECMRKEFFWLEHMRYEMCVSCPVCSLQKESSKCRKHRVRGCDCLHLLSELEMQNLRYCKRPVVCVDRRICKEMFVPWFSFLDEQEGRISLTKQQNVNGRNEGEQHKAVSTREQSLVLPDGVLKAIRSQSCDAADVVAQLEERVENLQLKSAALADPTVETKQWIRCLAINAKNENRMDIVTHLRSIAPAGTTGPLLAENLDVRCIPFKQRKALTFNLCGGDEWKLLAEKLGMSYDEIRVLDKRTLNPCDVALNLVANSRHLNVGEVYDILVECELAGSADLL